MRMRPSGSLSMRMMMATVPVRYRSSSPGSSFWKSFCAVSMMTRFSASA
jgi:hypothetical protein